MEGEEVGGCSCSSVDTENTEWFDSPSGRPGATLPAPGEVCVPSSAAIVDLTVLCPCERTLRAGGGWRDLGAWCLTAVDVFTHTSAFLCRLGNC